MKKVDWKVLILTGLVCLLPIFLGLSVYDALPETMVIHWGLNNEPNGWASKNLVVFGFPVLMMLIQAFLCVMNDVGKKENVKRGKFEKVVKAIIPCLSVILYIVTILWALGNTLDIRKIVCFLVGIILLAIGNYAPKVRYEENKGLQRSLFLKNEMVWEKVKRKFAYSYSLMGLLMIGSIFLPEIYSLLTLMLFILVAIGISAYAIYESRKVEK